MEPITIGIIGIILLMVLLFMGMQVAYAGALVGLIGLTLVTPNPLGLNVDHMVGSSWAGLGMAGTIPFEELSRYALSVLAMFVLIGFLAFHANLTQGVFHAMRMWFAWLPGGLGVATVFAAAAFAAVSGSSSSTAAIFARIAIPEMQKNGYQPGFSASIVAVGGTLASLIPPSGILVIYAIIVEESVGKLLIAGFIPGLLSACLYAASIIIRVKLKPTLGAKVEHHPWPERWRSLKGMAGVLLVIATVVGGIYSGWMTPVESGAVGAFIIFLLALANGMSLRQFTQSLTDSARIGIMILTVIWGILILVRFLGFSGLPEQLGEWVLSLQVDRFWILSTILLMYLVLGMFVDSIGMLLLTLPFIHPVILQLGYDPIWFGIVIVKMVEIGLVTPPIGLNSFVVAGVRPDIPLGSIFRGIWWFFICDVLFLILIIAFPDIVLLLPNTMFRQ